MVKRSTVVLLVLVMLCLPSAVQNTSAQVSEAQAQAEKDVNGGLWMGAGCLLGVVGYAIAYFNTPTPPASTLLAKSPEYVAQYTDAYKAKTRQLQTSKALTGCLVGTGAQVLFYVLVIGAAASSSTY